MLITHLGLTVRDPDRSRRFYLDVLGLDGSAYPEPWGFRVDLRDGFMLALIRGEPAGAELVRAVHFGAALSSAGAARELRDRLRGHGVPEIEWEDADDYVGVKVSDPDGYVVEVAYEARTNSAFAAARNVPSPENGDEALARLLAGNKRFVQGKTQSPRRDSVRRTEVAQGQKPFAIILTCSDSRLAPEVVFDEGLGDLFVVRVAGNTAPDPMLIGSMEYSALTFGSILLMVLGHDRCGAVEASLDVVTKGSVPPGEIGAATAPIVPAIQAVQGRPADQLLDAAIQENVRQTVQRLGQVPTLAELVQGGKLKIVGYEYDLHTGKVTAI